MFVSRVYLLPGVFPAQLAQHRNPCHASTVWAVIIAVTAEAVSAIQADAELIRTLKALTPIWPKLHWNRFTVIQWRIEEVRHPQFIWHGRSPEAATR